MSNLLIQSLLDSRRAIAVVFLFSAAVNVLMLTVPLYMMQVFDRVLASRSGETLIYLTAIALACLGAQALLEAARSQVLTRVSSFIDRTLGADLFRRSVHSALLGRPYQTESMRDLQQVRGILSGPALISIFDLPWVPLYLLVLFLVHPVMGWLGLGGLVVLAILAVAAEMAARRPVEASTRATMLANRTLDAANRNADVIDAMGLQKGVVQLWSRHNDEALRTNESAADRSAWFSALTRFLRLFLQILTLAAGAWLVVMQDMTAGATIAASVVMSRALAPIEGLVGSWKQLITAASAFRRVRAFTAEPLPRLETMDLPEPSGLVSVENVTHFLAGQDRPVLRHVSFTVQPGEVCAIVGPSGSGKSTLARALVGVVKPAGGHVRLDGADVYAWNRDQFGQFVGYLPQEIRLFAGTVRENISRFGDAEPAQVVQAATLAGAHGMILQLPGGYDAEVGDNGERLSVGQRQRVALARAMLHVPRLLVLDEPNANLDSDGELALFQLIRQMRAWKRTVIIVTHRPNVLQLADRILVLEDGAVTTFGDRDTLLPRLVSGYRPAQVTGPSQPGPTDGNAPKALAGAE